MSIKTKLIIDGVEIEPNEERIPTQEEINKFESELKGVMKETYMSSSEKDKLYIAQHYINRRITPGKIKFLDFEDEEFKNKENE